MIGDPGWPEAKLWNSAEDLKADEVVVFDLMDHLRRSFEEFCNTYHADIPFVDAFMGVHNFHKMIIKDIAFRKNMPDRARKLFFQMASDTFEKAMDAEMQKIDFKCQLKTEASTRETGR